MDRRNVEAREEESDVRVKGRSLNGDKVEGKGRKLTKRVSRRREHRGKKEGRKKGKQGEGEGRKEGRKNCV